MVWLQIVTYAAVAIAVLAMLAKAVRYLRAPEHFRWELYPVPHEKGRAEYGGSYLEELDWWTQPRHSDKFNELKEMMSEIILLKGVYHHNKRVWMSSFPFHFGMYLCIGWLALLLVGAVLQAVGVTVGAAGGFGAVVHYMTAVFGYAGLVLAGVGAVGLLVWRLGSSGQRVYNSPAEYVNLILVTAVVTVTLIAQLVVDPGFSLLRDYVKSLITFSSPPALGGLMAAEILLLAVLIMYIPLSRMSHFVAKYFLYHSIRWNDEPNPRGSAIEKRILELLNQKVGWSGPHIQSGRPWSEVVKETKNE
jgi:nitrate reductase gamma subunit